MTAPKPNLADLLAMIASKDLAHTKRRDMLSSVRVVARLLGEPPELVPLDVKYLRRRLEELAPESFGIKRTSWRNIRSRFGQSLQLASPMMPSAQRTPISPAWRALLDSLSTRDKMLFGTLFRFLTARGVEPSTVTLSDLDAFGVSVTENRLRANPEKALSILHWGWNRCKRANSFWPQIEIPREDKRYKYGQPWNVFPPSYRADFEAYRKVLAGEEIDEDGPLHPLRSSTLEQRTYQFRALASILVATGTPPETIMRIEEVARLEPATKILKYLYSEGGNRPRGGAHNLGKALLTAAKYWVRPGEDELKKISRMVSKLAPNSGGLTDRNRQRLSLFDDPDFVRRFYALPEVIAEELDKKSRTTIPDAVMAQTATAICILQAIPLRVGNLASLDLERHFVERGNRVYIRIPGHEVKNGRPYEVELPDEVARFVSWYCTRFRNLLVRSHSTALFPGQNAGHKKREALGVQISKLTKRYLGEALNAHFFRHVAAKLYLKRKRGQYSVVSRFLNHGSERTALEFYTGTETADAMLDLQEAIQHMREADAIPTQKRRKK
jgi:integrase